jgi:hypothetical protein
MRGSPQRYLQGTWLAFVLSCQLGYLALEASDLFRIGFLFHLPDYRQTASLSLQSI